ncbi:hypothetical protein FOA52_013843 [Chlamydomonas sp. UWO 241]|nr:hypothetical protein FOA52_013843 [Chlamydomonas sp. UWO 241]
MSDDGGDDAHGNRVDDDINLFSSRGASSDQAGKRKKKRGRQLDLNTHICKVDEMVRKVSFHFFYCTMSMARKLAMLVGMKIVLSFLVTSMALLQDVLAIVSDLSDTVDAACLEKIVEELHRYIDIENEGIYGENSIYGFFIRIIIVFITSTASKPGWTWSTPPMSGGSGDIGSGKIGSSSSGGDSGGSSGGGSRSGGSSSSSSSGVVYISMSLDKKSLIDVFENVDTRKSRL